MRAQHSAVLALGLILGACSPISPSVSKLAGYSSGSSESNFDHKSIVDGSTSDISARESGEETEAVVLVLSESEFNTNLNTVKKERPTQELDSDQLDDLAEKKEIRFVSTDKRILGQEPYLLKHSVNVYVSMRKSLEERELLKQKLKILLAYEPSSSKAKSGSIRVRVERKNSLISDPVKDIQEEQVDAQTLSSIEKMAVEFLED